MMDENQSIETATPEVTQAVETTQATETQAAPATPAEPAYEIPKKFLKADGTPDIERLAKSYQGMEKKLGKSFTPALSADEYEWTAPENGVELDEEGIKAFKEEALAQGFTTKQYEFLMNRYNEVVTGMRDAGPTAEKTEQVLKSEWGADYKANLQAAQTGFNEFAPSTANPNDPVWNHPEVMKLLARIGSEVREDSLSVKGTPGGASESIQAQIDALRNSPEYETSEGRQKMTKLYEKLFK